MSVVNRELLRMRVRRRAADSYACAHRLMSEMYTQLQSNARFVIFIECCFGAAEVRCECAHLWRAAKDKRRNSAGKSRMCAADGGEASEGTSS